MHTTVAPAAAKKGTLWTGRVLSTLIVLLLLMDTGFKFLRPVPPQVTMAMAHIGFPPGLSFGIGVLLLMCTVLYALPWTAVLGATLLTGYLGGAVAMHLRVGDPLFSHVLFPVYLGAVAWAGLLLREPRLRALLPLRR
jgi:DoxX-like family